jgi:hypothetical protein
MIFTLKFWFILFYQAEEVKGITIFRFGGSLYYASSEYFRDKLYKKTGLNPRKLLAKRVKYEAKQVKEEKKRLKEEQKEKKKNKGVREQTFLFSL